jgi:hypothetical protein
LAIVYLSFSISSARLASLSKALARICGQQRRALGDDAAQAGYIAETVLASREASIRLKSQAILFRASHHSATLECPRVLGSA